MFPDLPRWIWEIAFLGYAVVVTVFVLLERRRPTATLALLLALVFLPFAGLIAYLLLSRRKVRKTRARRARRMIDALEGTRGIASLRELPPDLDQAQRGLVRLALVSSAAPLRRADRVQLCATAEASFQALVRAIEGAQRSIHLEFYIWRDDASGQAITRALTERARAGVSVRVLCDAVGSLGLPEEHFADLCAAGGEIAIFGRLRLPFAHLRTRLNFRNHRKIVTVDARLGFLGGVNVGDEYLGQGPAKSPRWRDLMVEIEGDAVLGLEATFLDDWLATTGLVVDLQGTRPPAALGIDARRPPKERKWQRHRPDRRALEAANPFHPEPRVLPSSEGPLLQIIPSGPDLPLASALSAQFSAAIAAAEHRAYITTPYLIPDEALTLIIRTAAMRGVDVRILVPEPGKNDIRIAAWAARSYYDELLDAGCRIYEYLPGMLHAKYLIADEVAAIGSANMDVRSFHINYEITAMFYDAHVARALSLLFEEDLLAAREVRAEHRESLALPTRLAESLTRVLSPLL